MVLALAAGAGAVLAAIYERSRIKGMLRAFYRWTLPQYKVAHGHETVKVETALNSRCNSDWGGNPYEFHWGMFDTKKNLPGDIVEKVMNLSGLPGLTYRETSIHRDSVSLSFLTSNESDQRKMSWLMIESGMQQQAVGLVCAALGVGMVFNNQGRDGRVISPAQIETTKIKLGPMKPGYEGSYWTSKAPGEPSPWTSGNLADPDRKGTIPFLSILPELRLQKKTSLRASEDSLSQLLWAARGRTPHYYLARPWGLTIPTWGGRQDISSVYVIQNAKSFSYVNWMDDRPTHMLSDLGEMKIRLFGNNGNGHQDKYGLIIIGTNENTNRALWEVGYQLFNILAQAHSLGISYETHFLDDSQQKLIEQSGIKNPVIAFSHY